MVSAPNSAGYGSCWIQWLNNAPANGSSYRVKGNYHSNFPTNESFLMLQTMSGDNYNEQPWWYTTGGNNLSMDATLPVYDRLGGNVAIKFCSWGQTATEEVEATLRNLSVERVSAALATVKDNVSYNNNLISNNISAPVITCSDGAWCASHRNNNTTINISKVNAAGKLVASSLNTTGDFGTCWSQRINTPTDSTFYRLKADVNSNFSTNESYIKIETDSHINDKTFYTNGNGIVQSTFQMTDTTNPGYITVKFCDWGNGTAKRTATLNSIHFGVNY